MTPYLDIFANSFRSTLIFSLAPEMSWFVALGFGHNPLLITLAAFAGAMLGILLTFGLGYLISCGRDKLFHMDTEVYDTFGWYFSKYGIAIFLFQGMPFVRVFFLFAGAFRVKFWRVMAAAVIGRTLYYLYFYYTMYS